jgi:hypothetical protein
MNIKNSPLIWTAVHKPSGEFVCSRRATVKCRILARKFSSRTQAKEFLNNSIFPVDECSFVAYQDPANLTEEELNVILDKQSENLYPDGDYIL